MPHTVPVETGTAPTDTARDREISSKSNPQMWTDIFLNNNKNILDSLDRMQNSATKIKKILKSNNAIKLNALLESIQIKTK